jgi:hypothetical protein
VTVKILTGSLPQGDAAVVAVCQRRSGESDESDSRRPHRSAAVRTRYEARIVGPVDEASCEALRDLEVAVFHDGEVTVVSGELDQPGLHGLLERIRALHLELEDLRRVRTPPPRDP